MMPEELYVGPFPKIFAREDKNQFLKHFGAVNVEHIIQNNRERYAIARFKNSIDCEFALKKIHQIEIFGMRISAKYYDITKHKTKYGTEETKSRYAYPPPSALVIRNIAHALVAVPKFYTQVLHLMNKMNLPCPFGPLTEEPPLCREVQNVTRLFNNDDKPEQNEDAVGVCSNSEKEEEKIHSVSETESELESDEEVKSMFMQNKTNPKRSNRVKQKRINKKPKLEQLKQTLLNPKESKSHEPVDDTLVLQEVFEIPNINPKRTLNVKVQSTSLGTEVSDDTELVTEGFGKIYPHSKGKESSESKETNQFITSEELSNNRIPSTDWPIVPVFKNYSPGVPSSRLYIKNLAKTVTEYDLRFIFGRYLKNCSEEEALKFNIRLMKEGRMKGQAFINFPSEELATNAVQDVNGYILKDKPMVIVFGKIKSND